MDTNAPPTIRDARREAAASGDVMGLSGLEMLARVEADVDREEGWDGPPRLLLVTRELAPPRAVSKLEALTGGVGMDMMVFHANAVGPVPFATDGAGMVARLNTIALGISLEDDAGREKIIPPNLFAWAIVHEGWTLPLGREYSEFDHQMRREGRMHEHPERLELRQVFAVDSTEAGMGITRLRGQDDDERIVSRDEGRAAIFGPLVDGLRALMRASLGMRVDELYDEEPDDG